MVGAVDDVFMEEGADTVGVDFLEGVLVIGFEGERRGMGGWAVGDEAVGVGRCLFFLRIEEISLVFDVEVAGEGWMGKGVHVRDWLSESVSSCEDLWV